MKTFPGWRAVGAAMRWARQQHIKRSIIVAADGTVHEVSWRYGGHLVALYSTAPGVLGLYAALADGGRVEADDLTGTQVLRVLAALELIPAGLAHGTWYEQAVARFGEPRLALPEPVIRPGLNRRCWVWFINKQNHNIAIDKEGARFHVSAGSPGRRAELWTDAEPTDDEIRGVLNHAWLGYADDPAVPGA